MVNTKYIICVKLKKISYFNVTYNSKLMLDFLVTAGVICLTSAAMLSLVVVGVMVVVVVVVVVSDIVLLQSFH